MNESRARGALRTIMLGAVLSLLLTAFVHDAPAQRPRARLRAYPVEVSLDTLVFAQDTVRAPVAQTLAAVRAAYTALKISRDYADSLNGQLGTLRFRATYQLAGERLSVYFNCGQGIAGSNADTWRITMALVTFVQPAGEGRSRVGTGVVAEAQDMSGVSTEPAMCGSTGLLESRIARQVRAALGER